MKERDIEEIQQYLLEVFDEGIDTIEINLCDEIFEWNKKDNISFQQFMLNEKENFKKWIAEVKEWWEKEVGEYTKGCLQDVSFNIKNDTLQQFYTVEEFEEMLSLEDDMYVKSIEFNMKLIAVGYLNVCCRDHTYSAEDVEFD